MLRVRARPRGPFGAPPRARPALLRRLVGELRSHHHERVAPEAAPGVMGQAARWMLDANGNLRIRPRLDAGFARWLWRFRANCTSDAARAGTSYLRDRVRENIEGRRRDRPGERTRLRLAAERADGAVRLGCRLRSGQGGRGSAARAGIPSVELDVAGVAREEPGVSGSVVGGVLYPEDAHLDPGEFVTVVGELARSHGARIDEGMPVARMRGAHRVESIETPAGAIRPETVVLASGAWAPQLARGLQLPLLSSPPRASASRIRPEARSSSARSGCGRSEPSSRRCAPTCA